MFGERLVAGHMVEAILDDQRSDDRGLSLEFAVADDLGASTVVGWDVLDEAGARDRMRPEEKRHRRITARDVERVVARIAKIPERTVSSDDRSALAKLDRDLKAVVFGQDPAIDVLAAAIKMARSGLGKPEGCV